MKHQIIKYKNRFVIMSAILCEKLFSSLRFTKKYAVKGHMCVKYANARGQPHGCRTFLVIIFNSEIL
jgi:hypothetical protein